MPSVDHHAEWIGNVQPQGVLVTSTALQTHGIVPNTDGQALSELQARLSVWKQSPDTIGLLTSIFGWQAADVTHGDELPDALIVPLPETGSALRPDYAVRDPNSPSHAPSWQMLIRDVPVDADFDAHVPFGSWSASPHHLMTRLLQGTGIPTGLLVSSSAIRLIYLPQGETAGYATFPVAEMNEVRGRSMLAALYMLLEEQRLFGDPIIRLPALLRASRRHQADVSAKLSGQVLAALHALLRGLHTADQRVGSDRIAKLAKDHPNDVYGGLLTALMRLVFILYAEDRGLFPDNEIWTSNYTLSHLFTRLRDDAALYPDTMEDRFGAWAQIIALCRIVHSGACHGALVLPARRGALFDPDRYPFLEGRDKRTDAPNIPRIPDAVVLAILERLLILDGQRLLYSGLDVEQIGAVYETMMGFTVELTTGSSVAITSPSSNASTVIDLEKLVLVAPAKRSAWLKKHADRKPSEAAVQLIELAQDVPSLEAALHRLIDRAATPGIVPIGTPVLQPTEERRRSGSHYTPPSLTRPIVADTLAPILARLGDGPTQERILSLRIVDPAMGSGAFLVEACRQLASHLVAAWGRSGITPRLPADQDALEHARRLVATRCLCGVDRNPFAVEMARLSLWLATLARDHEFTFLDHALRHGDALIGLPRARIADLHWSARPEPAQMAFPLIRPRIARAAVDRRRIREALDDEGEAVLRPILAGADAILDNVRDIGSAICGAWFGNATSTTRRQAQAKLESDYMQAGDAWVAALQAGHDVQARLNNAGYSYKPFHWDIEFPEVFERENGGFDAVIGNPPYAGKNTYKKGNVPGFPEWLQAIHSGAHGNADLSAHFFLRGYDLLREGGSLGFVATNTIRQGDTRESGLRALLKRGATICHANRRLRWPGGAAVIVCVVHLVRGQTAVEPMLDGRKVSRISAFLEEGSRDEAPVALDASKGLAFQGSILLGMGFTFDDDTQDPAANPLSEMLRLTDPENPSGAHNSMLIRPYIGGEEVNDSPGHLHRRWAIDFGDMPLERQDDLDPLWEDSDAQQQNAYLFQGIVPKDYRDPVASDWPELLDIVRRRVKPERDRLDVSTSDGARRKRLWWKMGRVTPGLSQATATIPNVLAISRVSPHLAFGRLVSGAIFAETLVVFVEPNFGNFAVLQSRFHEVWARFFSSSLEDRLRYGPSDCLETFPFILPRGATTPELEAAGRRFHDARAAHMLAVREGLTSTHNRLDNPQDTDPTIVDLRSLHDAMDAAVLRAYGWTNSIPTPIHEPEWPGSGDDRPGPWRRRWSEADRARILEFLWQLNETQAKAEAARRAAGASPPTARRGRRPAPPSSLPLLELS